MDKFEDLKQIIRDQIEAYGGKKNPKDDFNGFINAIIRWNKYYESSPKPELVEKSSEKALSVEEMLEIMEGWDLSNRAGRLRCIFDIQQAIKDNGKSKT